MAGVWIALCVLTAAAALNFGLRLLFLRKSIREIAAGVEEKLNTDTNTVLTVSTGDQTARRLAAQLNTVLQALRKERLRLQNGDAALKTAVTNISHDLRTPLTTICGYLDLLEQETHTDVSKRYLAVIRERTDAMRTQTEELLRYAVAASTAESMHFAGQPKRRAGTVSGRLLWRHDQTRHDAANPNPGGKGDPNAGCDGTAPDF